MCRTPGAWRSRQPEVPSGLPTTRPGAQHFTMAMAQRWLCRYPFRCPPYLLLWGLEIAGSDLKLEPADSAVVTKIVARLRRVVTSKNNRQRAFVSIYRLRIIDPPTEEVRVVAAGRSYERRRRGRRHPRRDLGRRQCVGAGDIHDRRIKRIAPRFRRIGERVGHCVCRQDRIIELVDHLPTQ